jgi:hypothetical protein
MEATSRETRYAMELREWNQGGPIDHHTGHKSNFVMPTGSCARKIMCSLRDLGRYCKAMGGVYPPVDAIQR